MKMNATLSTLLFTLLFTVTAASKSNGQPLSETAVLPAEQPAGVKHYSQHCLQTAWPRVYKKLQTSYGTVSGITCSVLNKTLYLNFKTNNRAVSAVYSAAGKMKYVVISLGKTLPESIADDISQAYPGYTLYYSRQIQLQQGALYHIIIENSLEYRVLNFANEEITETGITKKQHIFK